MRVERPPIIRGTNGMEEMDGSVKPGLVQLMKRLFLDNYVEQTKLGMPVKRSLLLCRNI